MKVHELDTPAVIIDVDVMERNLSRLAAYCSKHGLALRPHTKTHKIPELAHRQIQHGAKGITVAKLGEAEVMAEAGLQDALIAYPILGEAKIRRLMDLTEKARIIVSTDSLEVACGWSSAFRGASQKLDVLVEFDTGFGRCGLPIEPASIAIVEQIAELPGLEYRGVLVYPGHLLAEPREREKMMPEEIRRLRHLIELLAEAGLEPEVVSGGSTPTATSSHRFEGLTEIRAGTYIFNDRNEVGCGVAGFEDCAATVLTTVVSTSVAGRAVVDGGSKTFSADRLLIGDRGGYGYILDAPDVALAGLSEEHGHLDLTGSTRKLKVGDRLRIVPNHICACMNLHDTVWGIQGDDVVAVWKVSARGRIR